MMCLGWWWWWCYRNANDVSQYHLLVFLLVEEREDYAGDSVEMNGVELNSALFF